MAGKKFCNKIWNATRFVLTQLTTNDLQLTTNPKPKTAADKTILSKLEKVKIKSGRQIDRYEFGQALHEIYDFFWHDFCDTYIESSKKQDKESTVLILTEVLINSLKLLHPFMPFITEEIWQQLPMKDKTMLIIEN